MILRGGRSAIPQNRGRSKKTEWRTALKTGDDILAEGSRGVERNFSRDGVGLNGILQNDSNKFLISPRTLYIGHV